MNARTIIDFSRRITWPHWLIAPILLVGLLGCGGEQESLYEHDHFVPAHWPNDVEHAAELIASRALIADQDATARKELDEVLSWIPEIAADTDLSEEDWLTLTQGCESLRRSLKGNFSDALRAELQQMSKTLETTHQTIIKLRPPGWSAPEDDGPDTDTKADEVAADSRAVGELRAENEADSSQQ